MLSPVKNCSNHQRHTYSYRYWSEFHTSFRWLRYIKTEQLWIYNLEGGILPNNKEWDCGRRGKNLVFHLMYHYFHKIILFSALYVRPSWPMHNESYLHIKFVNNIHSHPKIIFVPYQRGGPVTCIWHGKLMDTSTYLTVV